MEIEHGNNSCLAKYERVRGKSLFCGFSDCIAGFKNIFYGYFSYHFEIKEVNKNKIFLIGCSSLAH